MIREVLRMGDPRLLRLARPVTAFGTQELAALLQDMRDTMAHLVVPVPATPPTVIALRVVIFGGLDNPRYPEAPPVPDTVLINPELVPLSAEEEEGWEGCLSVPGLRGWVPRRRHLHYLGYDETGRRFERTAEGFHARVVQHECDHLDGVLYPMRVRDFRLFGFTDVLNIPAVAD